MKPLSLISRTRTLRIVGSAALAGCALSALVATPGVAAAEPVVPPGIVLVRLGAGFSPTTLRLGVGQQFEVAVDSDVEASGPGLPASCPVGMTAPAAGGLLILQCPAGGGYLYTAGRPGSATLLAMVRPRCAPATVCPDWIAVASLRLTIGPAWPGRPLPG